MNLISSLQDESGDGAVAEASMPSLAATLAQQGLARAGGPGGAAAGTGVHAATLAGVLQCCMCGCTSDQVPRCLFLFLCIAGDW